MVKPDPEPDSSCWTGLGGWGHMHGIGRVVLNSLKDYHHSRELLQLRRSIGGCHVTNLI